MKRGAPASDSDWVHQSEQKYFKRRDPVDLIGAGRAMPGMFVADPRKTRVNDYRVFRPMAQYKAARAAKPRTYVKRTATYPRKRAYGTRPKYGGVKGSRFHYSKYKPKSYYVQGSRANIKRMGKTWRTATKTQKTNRKRLGYYGRGSYSGALSRFADYAYGRATDPKLLSYYGKKAHQAALIAPELGIPEISPALEFTSRAAGAASAYMGRGSYKSNGLITGSASTMPRMKNMNDETGSLIVSHRERLMDVFAPADSGFHQDVFTVSPGIEKTFPWLSQIAANYEEYEMVQCVFEYDGHSLVGINDTLEVQGSLIMATQMNVKDKPFRDRHEMERFPHASKCAQHGSMAHGVECDPRKIQGDGHRYIRMGGLTKDEDARDFDHAKFTIGQYNTPTELAGKEIGQLFVYYTVKLMKPKISSGRGDAISTFRAFCENPDATRAFGRLGNDAAQTATNGMQVAARNSLPLTPTYGAPVVNAQGVAVFTPSNDLTLTFDPYVSGTFRVTVTISHDGNASGVTIVPSGSAALVKSLLPIGTDANNVYYRSVGNEAILIADVQVRPRDLATASLAAIKIDGLDLEDLTKSCIEVTEINILEETSVTDQPELKLIA
tara:strand:- start:3923 stop:5749 length:1827 start_codon:yes stop_codon:yes gene_type:complete